MKQKFILFFVAVFFSTMFLACSSEKPAPPAGGSSVDQVLKPASTSKTLKSTDGTCEITVPENWAVETDLNKDAKVQASMRMRDAYMVIFVDQKDKYGGVTLDEFADGAHKKLTKRLTSPVGTAGAQMTVGGLPAKQYELTGAAGGATFTYYQTLVEGPVYFYEILAWTPKTQVDKNKFTFEEAVKSFKEVTAN